MSDADPLLTIPEVAVRLVTAEWSARRLMRTGAIPSALIGGKWKARTSAVETYINAQIEATRVPTSSRRRRRRAS